MNRQDIYVSKCIFADGLNIRFPDSDIRFTDGNGCRSVDLPTFKAVATQISQIYGDLNGYVSYRSLTKWLHNGFDIMLISAGLGMFSYYAYRKITKVFSQSDDDNGRDLTPRKILTNSMKQFFDISKEGSKKYLLPAVGLVAVHRTVYQLIPYCMEHCPYCVEDCVENCVELFTS